MLFDSHGNVELLDSRGRPLGISRSSQYVNQTIAFPPRGSLFLYSDVMFESTLPSGDMLGEDGLLALVRACHDAEAGIDIPGLAAKFTETVGSPLGDDLTAVCVARLAPLRTSPEFTANRGEA